MRTKSLSRIAVALILTCLSGGLVRAQEPVESEKAKNGRIAFAVSTTPDVLIAGVTDDLIITIQNATGSATQPLRDGDVFTIKAEMEGGAIVEISPEVVIAPDALDETRLSASAGTAPNQIVVRYNGPDMPFGPGSAFSVKLKYATPNWLGTMMVSVLTPPDAKRFRAPRMWFDALMVGDESTIEIGNGTAAGPTGPAGPRGPQGDRGLTGDAGPAGAAGPAGPTGVKGDTGAAGPAGQRGAQGDAGAPGAQGQQGATGTQGPIGPAGATGAKGDTGAAGAQGVAGLAGLTWRSDWSAATSYAKNDAVTYEGSAWIALRTNQNATPVAGADWSLLAQKGEAGAAGAPGAAGAQGDPGPAGPAGQQGVQGLVGPQGVQGLVGPQGLQGLVGPQGLQGLVGPQGIQGLVGQTGLVWKQVWSSTTSYQAGDAVSYLGSSWIALRASLNVTPVDGADWAPLALQGLVGPQGVQGLVGPQGVQGLVGPQGIQGLVGPQGLQGLVGPQGIQGLVGPQGLQGLVGPQGLQGLVGQTGLVWKQVWDSATSYQAGDAVSFLGSSWIALRSNLNVTPVDGLDWAPLALQGVQGLVGPQGVQGLVGPQGIQGLVGPQGLQGLVGPQGLQGLVGPQGVQGLVGPQGLQGLVGPQGIQGLVGQAGLLWKQAWSAATTYAEGDAVSFDGSSWIALRANVNVTPVDGADWAPLALQGIQGLVGPQGVQGLVGPQGLQGLVGPQGLQGLVGPQGIQGLVGPQGLQGLVGPQGLQGLAGVGLLWKSAWSAATSYAAGDAVSFAGSSWIALRANVNVSPVDGDDWSPLALQGLQGLVGPQGVQGLVGPQGLQGLVGPQGIQGLVGPQGLQGLVGPQGIQGLVGPQGLQGLTGSNGVGGIGSALYAYATAPAITGLIVGSGSAINFSSTGASFGGITVGGGGSNFTLPTAGVYRVQFSGTSSLISLLGGIRVEVNGTPVGQSLSLISVGAPIQGEVMITANAGDVVTVVATGLAVTFAPGSGLGVTIMKLQ